MIVGPFGGLADVQTLSSRPPPLAPRRAEPLRQRTARLGRPEITRLSAWAWPVCHIRGGRPFLPLIRFQVGVAIVGHAHGLQPLLGSGPSVSLTMRALSNIGAAQLVISMRRPRQPSERYNRLGPRAMATTTVRRYPRPDRAQHERDESSRILSVAPVDLEHELSVEGIDDAGPKGVGEAGAPPPLSPLPAHLDPWCDSAAGFAGPSTVMVV